MSKSDISSRPRANLATTNAQKVYCQTDYPEIFSCTYWGQAPYTTYLHPPNIIRNRNKFIKDFKIKSSPDFHWPNGSMRAPLRKIGWYELNSQPYYTIWDHKELYIDEGAKNYILVTSPYVIPEMGDEFDRVKQILHDKGFNVYNSLYLDGTTTFVAVIKKGKN